MHLHSHNIELYILTFPTFLPSSKLAYHVLKYLEPCRVDVPWMRRYLDALRLEVSWQSHNYTPLLKRYY